MEAIKIKFSTIPPAGIYEQARDMFGVDFRQGVVFTVGDTIHANKFPLPAHLYAHEKTHVIQQRAYSGGPNAWWARYFTDVYFRYSQEMEAYRVQYKYYCTEEKDRNKRAVFLHHLLKHITTIYGFDKFPVEKIKKDLTK